MIRRLREWLARKLAPKVFHALTVRAAAAEEKASLLALQVDGLQAQVKHAAKVTNDWGARTREAEVAAAVEQRNQSALVQAFIGFVRKQAERGDHDAKQFMEQTNRTLREKGSLFEGPPLMSPSVPTHLNSKPKISHFDASQIA